MVKKFGVQLFIFVLLLHCALDAASQNLPDGRALQPEQSFENAIRDDSTSPLYASITVIDARSGVVQNTCVFGQDLLMAIHREYSLGFDASGRAKVQDIALMTPEHKFQFWNQDALDAIPFQFSASDLVIVRARFASISDEDIRSGFAIKPWGCLHEAYREPRYRDAAACVLIERGMAPAVDDRSRALYLP